MDMTQIMDIAQSALTLIVGGVCLYLRFSSKAKTKAKEIQEAIAEITAKAVIYIKEAELEYKDTTNKGGEKFQLVVSRLHDLIPDGLDKIITEDMIGDIVQTTFDEIEEYLSTRMDEAASKIPSKD